jgi:hypothetical protein
MATLKDKALEAVSAGLHYQLAQAERREAYAKFDGAGTLLDLRKIQERAAELRSQHEPMATFSGGVDAVREAILRAVRYVVSGRKEEK